MISSRSARWPSMCMRRFWGQVQILDLQQAQVPLGQNALILNARKLVQWLKIELNSFVMTRYIFHLTGLFGMLSFRCSNSALYHMHNLLCAICRVLLTLKQQIEDIIRVFDMSLLSCLIVSVLMYIFFMRSVCHILKY